MARISGVNIPTGKRVIIALTYIYGIGPKIAGDICSEASIDVTKRVNQLNDDEVNKIREIIEQKHKCFLTFELDIIEKNIVFLNI